MKDYTFGSVVRASAVGILAGGLAGFALGVLIAPEEGKKIRRRVAYQLDELANKIGVFVDQLGSTERGGEARRTGDALIADAHEKAQRIRNDIDALMGEMRRGTSEAPSAQ